MSVLRIPFRSIGRAVASAVLLSALVTACGGGGGGGDGGGPGINPPPAEPPATPTGMAVAYDVKAYSFSWQAVSGATFYRVFEDPDGPGPLPAAQVGGDIPTISFQLAHPVLLHERLNAQYTVSACNAAGCSTPTAALQPDLMKAIGYVKASNTRANHRFGFAVAISADGATLAVGAPGDDSSSPNDSETPDPALNVSGAVHVYVRDAAGIWSKQAFLKASNPDLGDNFGYALSLSADGNTLAVGAPFEDSKGTHVDSQTQDDDTQADSGAVYVFSRSAAGVWGQPVYVKASNTQQGDQFGSSVALSDDGATLAVGAMGEDGENNMHDFSGAVYVYVRTEGAWSWQAYLKAGNAQVDGAFGASVALSMTGDTLAVGSIGESSLAPFSGAVYVFARTGTAWLPSHFIKASNAGEEDAFGATVALSDDGDTLVAGAPYEASNGSGKTNDDAFGAGAVYVLVRADVGWTEQAYVKASNPGEGDNFGFSISLSADGSKLAVGAPFEASAAKGINGSQSDDSGFVQAGAVYLFAREDSTWAQQAYVKASNTRVGQTFSAVALSGDGRTLGVGAFGEDGRSKGVNADQTDQGTNGFNAGAVYLY